MTIRVNHVENADCPLNDRRLMNALQRLFCTASSASSLFRTMAYAVRYSLAEWVANNSSWARESPRAACWIRFQSLRSIRDESALPELGVVELRSLALPPRFRAFRVRGRSGSWDSREELCNAFMGEPVSRLEKRQSACHGEREAVASQVVEWIGKRRVGRPSRAHSEIAVVMAD
jgi:hypothetical protein